MNPAAAAADVQAAVVPAAAVASAASPAQAALGDHRGHAEHRSGSGTGPDHGRSDGACGSGRCPGGYRGQCCPDFSGNRPGPGHGSSDWLHHERRSRRPPCPRPGRPASDHASGPGADRRSRDDPGSTGRGRHSGDTRHSRPAEYGRIGRAGRLRAGRVGIGCHPRSDDVCADRRHHAGPGHFGCPGWASCDPSRSLNSNSDTRPGSGRFRPVGRAPNPHAASIFGNGRIASDPVRATSDTVAPAISATGASPTMPVSHALRPADR